MTTDELELLDFYINKVKDLEDKIEELKEEAVEVFAYRYGYYE